MILENVRLSFPALWEPKSFNGEGEAKYRAVFIIPRDSDAAKEIDKAINTVAADKWGAKAAATLASIKGNPNKFCYKDGDSKPQFDGFAGNMFLSASNAHRPTVIDRNKAPLLQQDGKPYAGCYVNALVEIWAQDNKYGKGIHATLRGVQFYKDGEAFGASAPASPEEFQDLSVSEDSDLV